MSPNGTQRLAKVRNKSLTFDQFLFFFFNVFKILLLSVFFSFFFLFFRLKYCNFLEIKSPDDARWLFKDHELSVMEECHTALAESPVSDFHLSHLLTLWSWTF